MDDYLAKPFRRDALRLVLERWVLDHASEPVDAEGAADGGTPATFDRSILEQMGANSAGQRLVSGLIDHYFVDAPNLIETLNSASKHTDAATLAHAAHLLGLASDFLGARNLAAMCGELERTALTGETHGLDERVARIRQEYQAVHLAMEAVRSGG